MEAFNKWFNENVQVLINHSEDLEFICKLAFLAGEQEQIKQRLKELQNGNN